MAGKKGVALRHSLAASWFRIVVGLNRYQFASTAFVPMYILHSHHLVPNELTCWVEMICKVNSLKFIF